LRGERGPASSRKLQEKTNLGGTLEKKNGIGNILFGAERCGDAITPKTNE